MKKKFNGLFLQNLTKPLKRSIFPAKITLYIYRVKNWSKVMELKGNYLTGNLACQNLGDCSLCFVPTIVKNNNADEKTEQKRTEKQNIVQKLFKKS